MHGETCLCHLQCQGWLMSLRLWAVLAAQPAVMRMLQPDPVPDQCGESCVQDWQLSRCLQWVHGYTLELLHNYPGSSHLPSWPIFGGKCWSLDSVKTLPWSEMQLISSKNLSLADWWKEQYLHVDTFLIYILYIAGIIHPPLMLNNHQLL